MEVFPVHSAGSILRRYLFSAFRPAKSPSSQPFKSTIYRNMFPPPVSLGDLLLLQIPGTTDKGEPNLCSPSGSMSFVITLV